MSVIVVVSDGTERLVPIGGLKTVSDLLDVVRKDFALPHPREAYEVSVGGSDLSAQMGSDLSAVGVAGCEERVTVRAKFAEIAKKKLAEEGIAGEAEAEEALTAAVGADPVDLERIRLFAAAKLSTLWSQIQTAAERGRDDVAAALLEGANADDVEAEDLETLASTVCSAGLAAAAHILFATLGADVDMMEEEDEAPLHYAAEGGHSDVVRILLDAGADVNLKSCDAWATPLHVASAGGHLNVAQLLLDHEANVKAKDHSWWTPLHRACARGHRDVVLLLLENNADVNATTRSVKQTPLHLACAENHAAVVQALLAKGADAHAKAGNGKTAMDIAQEAGHTGLVEILEEGSA